MMAKSIGTVWQTLLQLLEAAERTAQDVQKLEQKAQSCSPGGQKTTECPVL